ncbi:meiosis-specific nuclear structural protein 1-like [Leptopilina boulardi]|uniref:meiosis-specific nuclear structural protein 1-like n=1 Tax=Leptopilina boulardi TaxID=63433 RepID=UPI0021F53B7D|nr:meiosis-specific nuclear structural protein 1-like [Leptopilina boulardi]
MEVLNERNLLVKKQEEEKIRKREEAICLVAGMIIAAESSKEKREALIVDLVSEEIQCQEMIREKEKYFKKMKEKDELMNVLDKQVLFNEECKRRFVEEDRDFTEAVMKRILEDERLERSTLEARKRKSLIYREELQRLIENKKLFRDKEIIRIQEEVESEQLQKTLMMKSIRDERISLLEHHMKSVAEFINKSGLTKEEQNILASHLKSLEESSVS